MNFCTFEQKYVAFLSEPQVQCAPFSFEQCRFSSSQKFSKTVKIQVSTRPAAPPVEGGSHATGSILQADCLRRPDFSTADAALHGCCCSATTGNARKQFADGSCRRLACATGHGASCCAGRRIGAVVLQPQAGSHFAQTVSLAPAQCGDDDADF